MFNTAIAQSAQHSNECATLNQNSSTVLTTQQHSRSTLWSLGNRCSRQKWSWQCLQMVWSISLPLRQPFLQHRSFLAILNFLSECGFFSGRGVVHACASGLKWSKRKTRENCYYYYIMTTPKRSNHQEEGLQRVGNVKAGLPRQKVPPHRHEKGKKSFCLQISIWQCFPKFSNSICLLCVVCDVAYAVCCGVYVVAV